MRREEKGIGSERKKDMRMKREKRRKEEWCYESKEGH